MTRRQLAEFLTASGYPISLSYLEKLSAPSLGQGPPTSARWGRRPLYDPEEALRWAENRLSLTVQPHDP
jgi:hypothetical protein